MCNMTFEDLLGRIEKFDLENYYYFFILNELIEETQLENSRDELTKLVHRPQCNYYRRVGGVSLICEYWYWEFSRSFETLPQNCRATPLFVYNFLGAETYLFLIGQFSIHRESNTSLLHKIDLQIDIGDYSPRELKRMLHVHNIRTISKGIQ